MTSISPAPASPTGAQTQRLLEELVASNTAILAELRTLNHRLSLGTEGGVSSVELETDSKGQVKPKVKIYAGPGIPDADAAYIKAAEIVNRGRREFNSGS